MCWILGFTSPLHGLYSPPIPLFPSCPFQFLLASQSVTCLPGALPPQGKLHSLGFLTLPVSLGFPGPPFPGLPKRPLSFSQRCHNPPPPEKHTKNPRLFSLPLVKPSLASISGSFNSCHHVLRCEASPLGIDGKGRLPPSQWFFFSCKVTSVAFWPKILAT